MQFDGCNSMVNFLDIFGPRKFAASVAFQHINADIPLMLQITTATSIRLWGWLQANACRSRLLTGERCD